MTFQKSSEKFTVRFMSKHTLRILHKGYENEVIDYTIMN